VWLFVFFSTSVYTFPSINFHGIYPKVKGCCRDNSRIISSRLWLSAMNFHGRYDLWLHGTAHHWETGSVESSSMVWSCVPNGRFLLAETASMGSLLWQLLCPVGRLCPSNAPSIDVKNIFYVFYFCHVFKRLFFNFLNVFYFKKSLSKFENSSENDEKGF